MTIGTILIVIGSAFLLSVLAGYAIIPALKRMKFGQSIREEGPQSHMKKAGTPTMGGLIFLTSIVLATVILSYIFNVMTTQTIVLLIILIGFGVIGFIDDYIIVVLKRNLGLTSLQKLVGQIIIAILAFFLLKMGPFETTVALPFMDFKIDLGVFYVAFIIFWLVGFSNAVNITDGLDGLVAGISTITFSGFAVLALHYGQTDIALFGFSVAGAMLGFLLFNMKPAKVFMGDTGSLALGGAIAMISILIKQELLLLIIGIVFVVETLSVILQVASFKLTGKRIFKMSPIHHHFEESGWSEWKIVVVFWFVALIATVIPLFVEVL